ncbi:MAG: DNA polymerase III subunit chi [Pseudomonadota bacterium]|nr:DNA polymerase III subunit chi [Pseudomonadota bacterium]
MPDVRFYVIQQPKQRVESLACRLCRRVAIGAQQRLFVRFSHADDMRQFDALLWTFEADSFVPHGIDDLDAPICLGLIPPPDFQGCCLNLADDAVDSSQFEQVLEIIGTDPEARQRGRQRFRDYRQQGLEPQTHQV